MSINTNFQIDKLSQEELEGEQALQDCAAFLRPTPEVLQQRKEQTERLMRLIRGVSPEAVAQVVGSEATGLSSRRSDVDIMVLSPQRFLAGDGKRDRPDVGASSPLFDSIFLQLQAEFPKGVTKLEHTKIRLIRVRERAFTADISFDNPVAVANTQWAADLVRRHPVLADAHRLLKHWYRNRSLPDGKVSGISSHCLFLMLVHVFLFKGLHQLSADHQSSASTSSPSASSPPLFVILRTFFRYFSAEFDFETQVVSATPYLKTKDQVERDWSSALFRDGCYPGGLGVIDLNEPGRNLTAWLPPVFVVLLVNEMRNALQCLDLIGAESVAQLFQPLPNLSAKISENKFYLALLPSGQLKVVYARLIWSSLGEQKIHIRFCRWNARNVEICWNIYDIDDSDAGTFKINRSPTSETIGPTSILTAMDHAPRISPAPRHISLPLSEIDRLHLLQ